MNLRFIPLGALCALAGFGFIDSSACLAAEPETSSAREITLTLEEALSRTLAQSADLTVAAQELHAVEAEAKLAMRLPNPELTVAMENVAGDGAYSGTSAAELTIGLSQPVELGGKRRLRREAAELGRQLAANGQLLTHFEVLATTRQRFVAVLAAQEQLALATEQEELTTRSLAAANERIKVGKAPTIDRARLQGEAGLAGLAVAQAQRVLLTARLALAASWGDGQANFDRVAGDLSLLPALPSLDQLDATVEHTAAARNQRLAADLSKVELKQAIAARIPDPTLTVGWRQFGDGDAQALLFGVSVPLPLFSRNEAAVAAASSRYEGAKARELSAGHQARSAMRSAWQALADARSAAEVIGSQVVPAAAEGFAAAEYGYRAGKFGLLELLDAQRSLFDARQQQLAARTGCHLAAIELRRLMGTEATAVVQ